MQGIFHEGRKVSGCLVRTRLYNNQSDIRQTQHSEPCSIQDNMKVREKVSERLAMYMYFHSEPADAVVEPYPDNQGLT